MPTMQPPLPVQQQRQPQSAATCRLRLGGNRVNECMYSILSLMLPLRMRRARRAAVLPARRARQATDTTAAATLPPPPQFASGRCRVAGGVSCCSHSPSDIPAPLRPACLLGAGHSALNTQLLPSHSRRCGYLHSSRTRLPATPCEGCSLCQLSVLIPRTATRVQRPAGS